MPIKFNQLITYNAPTDDIVQSANQHYQLPDDYRWRRKRGTTLLSNQFQLLIRWFAKPVCRLGLHITVQNAQCLDPFRHQGIYLYGNHTQPTGDVLLPFVLWRHPAIIASPANLGIPVIGRLLPAAGALPIPGQLHQLKPFTNSVYAAIDQRRAVTIYPEAHVWPYATMIRPFPTTAFHYPVAHPAPVFCMTSTFQHVDGHTKPRVTVFIDGPFYVDNHLTPKQQQQQLHQRVINCMTARSQASTYEYVHYQRRSQR